jgi:hypothetical protein
MAFIAQLMAETLSKWNMTTAVIALTLAISLCAGVAVCLARRQSRQA